MRPILKLVIAILLLLCLADMPYGFYTLVRFTSAFAFAYLSYDYFKSKKDGLGFVFAALLGNKTKGKLIFAHLKDNGDFGSRLWAPVPWEIY